MPLFYYEAKKGLSEIVRGEITAENREDVVARLADMQMVPVRLVEQKVPSQAQRAVKPRGKASMSDLTVFIWQLASLTRAGVLILKALQLISEQSKSPSFRVVVDDLRQQVKEGKTLSEAMSRYPGIFNRLFTSMIKSGERSGGLGQVLDHLARHLEEQQDIRRRVQTAMAYPALMLTVGIGTVFIIMTFFLPKIVNIFENARQALPVPTVVLINISNFISAYWYWFFLGIFVVVVILARVGSAQRGSFALDMVKLHLPVVKDLVRNAEVAKFARTLGILLKNGLPVYESLDLASGTLDNVVLQQQLRQVSEQIVRQGSSLSASLAKAKVFPVFVVNMITVGEEGGKLEESLAEVAVTYERQVAQSIRIMTSVLEPALILLIGAVVGFIVFALMLPVLNIGPQGI